MLRVLKDNQPFSQVPDLNAFYQLQALTPNQGLSLHPDDVNAWNDQQATLQIRQKIDQSVGDIPSLVGTTADAAQLLLVHFSTLIIELNQSQSIEDIKAASQSFLPFAKQIINHTEDKTTRWPYQVKGEQIVLSEIEQRATKVADVLNPDSHHTEGN